MKIGVWATPGRPARIAALMAVFAIASFFRLQGLRWDAACPAESSTAPPRPACTETHLHPDERFLTMVAGAIGVPTSPSQYLDTATSPANPHNRGHGFFAYGLFPVLATKVAATPFGLAGYDQVHLVGRALSVVSDLLSILLLFLVARRLYDWTVACWAALFLALAVLPIQQAHFFTVDSMVTMACTLGLVFAVDILQRGRLRDYLFFGLALGLAMAIKVSVLPLAILAAAAAVVRDRDRRAILAGPEAKSEPWVWRLALAALASGFVFRLLNPYAFSGPGFFGLAINPAWLANMREVSELVGGWRDFPPGHQWTDRTPLWFPWKNMMLVGLGPLLGIAAWTGWAVAGWRLLKTPDRRHLLPWLWVAVLFAHQGTQWVKSLRYLLPIYPALALFAAFLLVGAWRRAERSGVWRSKLLAATALGAVALGTLAWAWAFTAIYRRPHSRVEASRWIYRHVPEGAGIAHETWDDALPVPLDGFPGMARYRGLPLHPYAEDEPRKLDEMLRTLDQADFLVVSSNRVYDSVARLPMRFPMTLRYYQALFSGELGFDRVAEFTSYPRLFGFSFPDQGAEEAFSVYDHPRVQIFARTPRWSATRARTLLDIGDWDRILQLTPREAGRYRSLDLAPEQVEQRGRAGDWFPSTRGPLASLLLWVLCVEGLGLIAFPLALAAFHGLADRGWLLSKTVGLLALAYLGWLGGSLGWWSFEPANLRRLAAVLAIAALAAAWRTREELADLLRRRWRLLLAGELIFWSFFALLLAIRYLNPDLWHPFRGGEKPMDLAYLNAVVRSGFFPPADPWFAGGSLNYYYFGFVLTGSLSLLAGVPTAVAYNLAVPTFFALAAGGAVSATGALITRVSPLRVPGRRFLAWGLVGAAAVLLVGNQGLPRLVIEKFRANGPSLAIQDHWLYWTASRAIPHPAGEPSPITEFPLFTFLFGDLHAHLMAMPITLLILATLAGLMLQEAPQQRPPRRQRILDELSILGLLALAVGGLAVINTWDLPTLLGITALALVVRELSRHDLGAALIAAGWRLAVVALGGRLLYWPFHAHFVSAYGRIESWRGSRTPLDAFLTVHVLFLVPILAWLLLERRPWEPAAGARLRAGAADAVVECGGWTLGVLLLILGFPVEALLVVVLGLSAGSFLTPGRSARDRFVAGLVLAGAALALAVEHLVLVGDVGRMNTVFKTYLQIWILWGLAATCAVASRSHRRKLWIGAWLVPLLGALSYPLFAIPARVRDRFEHSTSRGLDGRAFLATTTYDDERGRIELRWDGEAIRWLERNVEGSPVILEASVPIYRWGSRFSVHTGLPTVLGWDWHQQQQRTSVKNDPVGRRRQHVTAMFGAQDAAEIRSLLELYRVRYVVVGQLERLYYPAAGLAKFDRDGLFREVYRNPGTVIYEVDTSASSTRP